MGSAAASIGVDVGGTSTKGAIVNRSGTILHRIEHPTDPAAGTKGVLSVVEDLLEHGGSLGVRVGAVGVGAAGFIDSTRGAVTFSPNVVYDDPAVAEAVRTRFSLPAVVDNDANAAVWGERSFGSAHGSDHVAMLTLGTGVGSGFVHEGRLVRGFTGAAAEFGHVVVDPAGPPCPCGLRGCLEQFASGTAIARMARQAVEDAPSSAILAFAGSPQAITAVHVARAAGHYDETAREVLRRAGRMLGLGLSNVVNVFDPEVIVLGGSVVQAGEPFLGAARDELHRVTVAQRRRPMRLDVSVLGDDAGIVGAAALALDEATA